ncbi:toprim domain-containing protein [Kribbella sp. ALI-6-A]|uniref:toprim domain-containing protein n=1 Tax=Kribbella sp. ALI-6-A TaxID=1933817 RepID=UPI0009FBA352|nr:toprim domain-containing protein [Kribbella sp. ALI-6-A]
MSGVPESGTSSTRLVEAHVEAIRFYRGELLMRPGQWATAHLQVRGLGQVLEPGSRWRVGYAPAGWSHLVEHLRGRGFHDAELIDAGLALTTGSGYLIDRFRDRIMFPVHDHGLDPVGFIGRGRGRSPKYLNTATTTMYRKREVLVGVAEQEPLLARGTVPVLVEGPPDSIAVSLSDRGQGRWAGVALCGTNISSLQAEILRAYTQSDTVVVVLDGDVPGRTAAARCLEPLSRQFSRVLVADLPDGEDPASLFRSPEGRGRLRAELEATRPLVSLVIELELGRWSRVLDHVNGRIGALRSVAALVRQLPSALVADEIARLSRILNLDTSTVTREVLDANAVRIPRERAVRTGSQLAMGADPPVPGLSW